LARFEREAKLLAALNHPNIAHVYGFESATLKDGSATHFLAMELVPGEDLAERLERGPIPVDEALAIAKQIAEGLEEAHEHGVVHRDRKPANVKVTPDGKAKVLDFGLAKSYAGELASGSSRPRTEDGSRPAPSSRQGSRQRCGVAAPEAVTRSLDPDTNVVTMTTMRSRARVGARELKTRLGTYLRRAREGERIVVTEHGTPVAELRGLVDDGVDPRLARLQANGLVTLPTRRALGPLRPVRGRGPSVAAAVVEDREDRF